MVRVQDKIVTFFENDLSCPSPSLLFSRFYGYLISAGVLPAPSLAPSLLSLCSVPAMGSEPCMSRDLWDHAWSDIPETPHKAGASSSWILSSQTRRAQAARREHRVPVAAAASLRLLSREGGRWSTLIASALVSDWRSCRSTCLDWPTGKWPGAETTKQAETQTQVGVPRLASPLPAVAWSPGRCPQRMPRVPATCCAEPEPVSLIGTNGLPDGTFFFYSFKTTTLPPCVPVSV